MRQKYIRENKTSFSVVKNSKTYTNVKTLDDAIFIRDLLVKLDWDLNQIPHVIKNDDYLVLNVLDEKVYLIAKYMKKPDEQHLKRLIKSHERNPNNSRYGLNISKVFDVYVISKRIVGDDYVFGYYDELEDAKFVRNFLMDHSWNVNEFEKINYCGDTGDYKVVNVIDDKVYVMASFKDENEIDYDEVLNEFANRVTKHKHGLAHHPHLDELKDHDFNVNVTDDFWSFENDASSPLNDIIFNLTPFEQAVLNSIGENTSLEDIERSLIRFKSKNFDIKIDNALNSLIEKNIIKKEDEGFSLL